MSDTSLNFPPSPELLAAAQGSIRPRPDAAGAATGPANPAGSTAAQAFAALLAGVLDGTQPTARTPLPEPGNESLADLAPPAAPEPGTPLALPGAAVALPASTAGASGGNALPATGNPLPVLAGLATHAASHILSSPAPDTAAATAPGATAADTNPAPAVRARVFLADLTLTKPVDPGSSPMTAAVADAADGARPAAAHAFASRSLVRTGDPAATAPPRATVPAGFVVSSTTPVTLAPIVPAGSDALTPGVAVTEPARTAALPGAGTGFLAGQLAAFAAGTDAGTPAPAAGSGLPGNGVTDTGSGASLARSAATGLPPLQALGNPGAFAGGLADRLLTLGGAGTHSARLKLHPEHLGELDVQIAMDDGTAQVWFSTTTTQAREVIEGSLPRLRELFAEQGIQLTRAQVDAGSGQAGHPGADQQRRMTAGSGLWDEPPAWQRQRGSALADAGIRAATLSTRLLDVWA